MGWKTSTIIVNNPDKTNYEQLLRELGFVNLKRINDKTFEAAMNPASNEVYIGLYEDNLLICTSELPIQFCKEGLTRAEQLLNNKFPSSEICALVLHSVVSLWGYAISKNGQKIRARAGSADDGTFIDMGLPLKEEIELLNKSTINEDGERVYLLDSFPDETFAEDQFGENFVFAISSRYFDEDFDQEDNPLFETLMAGYSFSKYKISQTDFEHTSVSQSAINGKPWWKFW